MSDSSSSHSCFNTIFVEESAEEHPKTREILDRLNTSTYTTCKHHKDVFNRKNQLFSAQKSNPSLILARKEPPFIYPFSDFIQDYAHPSFYISILKNCIYDCKYCYLQQNDSANLLYFVNNDEFINEASKLPKNARISISY
ncbi:MAG: hypothetical protein ACLFQJ_05205, partial [Campylobacterales bacterium]